MARPKFKKKIKNGHEYFFYRFRHESLKGGARDLYAKTQGELEEKIKELRYETERGVISDNSILGDYLERFLKNVHSIGKAPSTVKKYDALYKNYLNGTPLMACKMRDLNGVTVQTFFNELVTGGATTSTVKDIFCFFKPCMKYAFREGKILSNFGDVLAVPNGEKKSKGHDPARALSIEEENALIKASKGADIEAFVLTALNTGLRRGELLALTWEDVDMKKRIINVNKSYDTKARTIGKPKTEGSIRQVPFPQSIVEVLKRHKTAQNKEKLAMGASYMQNNLVFCRYNGQFLAQTSLDRAVKTLGEKIGVQPLKIHDFRKTYATRLWEQEDNLKMIGSLVGHSNISTTADIYTQTSNDKKQAFIDSVLS